MPWTNLPTRARKTFFKRYERFFQHNGLFLDGFQFHSFQNRNREGKPTGVAEAQDAGIEFLREVLTEYIWHGGRIRYVPSSNQERETAAIKQLQQLMNQELQSLVGKIVICDE